jgi:hypothetical protein
MIKGCHLKIVAANCSQEENEVDSSIKAAFHVITKIKKETRKIIQEEPR